MNTPLPRIVLFLLLISLLFSGASAKTKPGKWKLAKKTDKIKVYRRPLKGYAIDEFKGVGADNVRIEVVGVILEDVNGYKDWMEYVSKSRIVKRINENAMIVYQRYAVPWPLDDRDTLVRIDIKKNYKKGRVIITIKAIDEPLVPLPPKTVRIKELYSKIILQYIDREHTRGEYTVRVDFAGHIPTWLANIISREIPFVTLTGIGKQARTKKYIDMANKSHYKKKIEEAIEKGFLKK
ncbi:MAG: hypothetical protein GY754_04690 [bacterium]|nr:hypothetical protein [bacterium]